MRTPRLLALAVCTLVAGCGSSGSGDASSPEPQCTDVALPTTYGPLYGQLCLPGKGEVRLLQVLVHGGTYDHSYWNFPGFGGRYSYSDHMNRAGYATLAIDQLGVGRSVHPPSATVLFETQANALHQVISAAREGGLGSRFERIVVVAHSIGSLLSLVEAVRYQDIDGLVLSGFSHSLGVLGFGQLLLKARPALLDPVTADRIPPGDLGYLSVVGGREVFYQSGDAEPELIEADEASRSELPIGMLTLVQYAIEDSGSLDMPVLIANGGLDLAFCRQGNGGSLTDCSDSAALLASEQPHFQAARLQAWVLPEMGHNLNLIVRADAWYARAQDWFDSVFAP